MKYCTGPLAVILATCAALVSSCHNLTEFEGGLSASVVFLRTSDHTIEATLEGIPDGRVICSIDDRTFYVLTGSGDLYRIDSREMAVDTVISVFSTPGSGMYDLVAPPPRSSVYVIGGGSSIVEVDIDADSVVDVFQTGPSPYSMISTRGSYQTKLYIGDSQDNTLREVDTSSNHTLRILELSFAPHTIGLGSDGNYVMVCSRVDEVYGLVNLQTNPMRLSHTWSLESPVYDIQVVEDSSDFFMCCPEWSGRNGFLLLADSLGILRNPSDPIEIPGSPFSLASTPDGRYLYVLSNMGYGKGLLTVIDVTFGGTVAEIPLDAYPWDVTVHRNGELVLVLLGE
jgi:DNA-binding beta-propeller fold protein YncE